MINDVLSPDQSSINNLPLFCMLKTSLTLFFVALGLVSLNAQKESSAHIVQVSGIIVTGDSLSPVPLSTVYRLRDMRGTVSDMVGFFSLPAKAGDTLVFSNIGNISTEYVIPEVVTENRISLVQFLRPDTIQIDVAQIFPWPHPSKFKQEFLALNASNNEYELGRKNLEAILLYDKMSVMHADGSENYRRAVQQQADRMYYNGQANPISLLNPIAWAQFIQAWRNGDFRRQ